MRVWSRSPVVIHHESERLNAEIQNILDASRISSDGLQVKLEWSEPADFVNAALERCRHRLAKHKVEVEMPDELVLLHIDSVLMERALGQIHRQCGEIFPATARMITVRASVKPTASSSP